MPCGWNLQVLGRHGHYTASGLVAWHRPGRWRASGQLAPWKPEKLFIRRREKVLARNGSEPDG